MQLALEILCFTTIVVCSTGMVAAVHWRPEQRGARHRLSAGVSFHPPAE